MLLKIFKTIAMLVFVVIAAAAAFGRWKLEGLAQRVAAQALSGAAVRTGAVHARTWPPAAIVDDFVLRGAAGEELLRARKLVLPLGPGAWIGHGRLTGTPELQGFVAKLRLTKSATSAPGVMPDWPEWIATGGRIEVREGDGPAPIAFALTGVKASRHAGKLQLDATLEGEHAGAFRLEGDWKDGRLSAHTTLGPFAGADASTVLIAPPAIVRGGEAIFAGTLTLDPKRAQFKGDVEARELLVEGSGTPSLLESRLRAGRGHARVPFALDVDLTHGADWPRVIREAVDAGAR